jgi:hypothetical protein
MRERYTLNEYDGDTFWHPRFPDCGLQIADCGIHNPKIRIRLRTAEWGVRNPQSEIRNPKCLISRLRVYRGARSEGNPAKNSRKAAYTTERSPMTRRAGGSESKKIRP